jgi:hypothetical protein
MALQNARCIRPGIGKILKDELVLAQALVNGKRKQLAIDTCAAMVREVQILAAKRLIPGTCTIGDVNFSPASVLIADIRDLMGNRKAGTAASPVNDDVVDSRGLRIANVTVTPVELRRCRRRRGKGRPVYFFPTRRVDAGIGLHLS